MQWFDTLKEDNTEKYLVNITSDVMLDNYMKDMSGKKRNNLKIALENFTENPEKYPAYAQLTGALERAKEALEELKEMSKRTKHYVPTMEKALTELGKGNITNMLELLNKEVNRQNTDFIKALVKKHKLKILQYSKKLEEDDREKLMKVLQEKYNFAPAEESKYVKRRPMSTTNIEKYLTYVITKAPAKAREDLLPSLGYFFGGNYSKLPPALLYIIQNPSINYKEVRFEKPPIKESIQRKKAIQDLKTKPLDEFSRLKTLMDAAKRKYAKSDARDKQNKIDRAFMDSLTADDKKMFAVLTSKTSGRKYSMSVQDYRDLEDLEDDTLRRYGFKDENEFNTWLDNEAVEAANDAVDIPFRAPAVIVIAPFVVTLPLASIEKFVVSDVPIDNAPALVILKAVLSVAFLPTIASAPNLDCVTPPLTIVNPLASKLAVFFEAITPLRNSTATPNKLEVTPPLTTTNPSPPNIALSSVAPFLNNSVTIP